MQGHFSALVGGRLDCCNSLLSGITNTDSNKTLNDKRNTSTYMICYYLVIAVLPSYKPEGSHITRGRRPRVIWLPEGLYEGYAVTARL